MTLTGARDVRIDNSSTVCMKVLDAVAQEAGVDPLDLDRRLATVIDTDALDALYTQGEPVATVEFTYHGYRVTVSQEGDVTVSELDS